MRFILLLALGFVLRGEGWRFEVTTVKTALGRSLRRIFGGVVLAGGLSTAGGLMFAPLEPVHAADWSDRNRLAAETWRTVDESYVDRTFNGMDWFKLRQGVVKREYKTDEAVYVAIRDMLANLGDPYTRYLPPAQYTALINSAVGELTGVGLELTTNAEDGSVRVVNVADGSPAIGSGILPGDVLVNVDGTPTAGLSAEEVAALIRGKQNTKASLRLSRASREGGPTTESDYVVVRQSFKLKGVGWERVKIKGGKDVGLVTVKSFSGTTRDDILKALVSFHAGGGRGRRYSAGHAQQWRGIAAGGCRDGEPAPSAGQGGGVHRSQGRQARGAADASWRNSIQRPQLAGPDNTPLRPCQQKQRLGH